MAMTVVKLSLRITQLTTPALHNKGAAAAQRPRRPRRHEQNSKGRTARKTPARLRAATRPFGQNLQAAWKIVLILGQAPPENPRRLPLATQAHRSAARPAAPCLLTQPISNYMHAAYI
jgi:hypothetical protein